MPNLINKIATWWLGEGEQPAAPARPARPGAVEPITPDAGPDDIQNRLGAILEHQARVSAGTVQLLGLESLKEKLGSRWPPVRDRVHQLAERLLNQSLGPGDVVFPYGPDTYLVVFAQMDERAAGLLCARVLQDLQRLLLGDADTATIVVRTAVRQVTGDLVLKPHRLADLLAGTARAEALAKGRGEGAPASGKAAPGWTDLHGAPGRGGGGTLIQGTAGGSGDPGWMPLPSQGGRTGASGFRQGEVTAAWAAHGQLGPLEIVYRPVWDANHQALCLYITRGRRMRRGGQAVYGYDTIPQAAGPQAAGGGTLSAETLNAILDLDEEAMRQAIAAYLELYDNRFRFFLSLPVHYETLAGVQRRRSYVALASRIPAHLVPFLTYHLVGLPEGTPTGRLADFVTALRPFGRNLMVGVALGRQDMGTLAAAGVKGVGVILPGAGDRTAIDHPGAERLSPERVATDLGLVGAEARRHHLKLYVEGVDSVETEGLVDRVGADFIAGDLIGGWTEAPEHIVRMSRVDLLANSRHPPG
ncbi:GGDEF domain-containing protein [Nitrospirillum amazonense]|uniref:GGDEF domain-containing protein n=1 Tax=Nitrospirillum amazonense TaxID=28077 RepID=A0A560FBV3_9PROT|nr:hypothetical protein [Nitrospirillum amazonense]TWB19088.1 GGDEF domain-containing protein [Nitrospirillum amazonense]